MGDKELPPELPEAGNSSKKDEFKRKPRPHKTSIKDDITNLAHLSILSFVILITYLCFARPFEFFTWHPLLMSLGWVLLVTEGVLIISKENPIVHRLRLNHTLKLFYHWILITAGLIVIGIGFLIVLLNKNILHKDHFKTWHALFGLLGLIGCVPAVLNGIATLWDVNIKQYIKPSIIKLIHQASGTVALIFGGSALILSVYSNWFIKASNNNKYLFLIGFSTTVISMLWTLQRPLLKCFRKLF